MKALYTKSPGNFGLTTLPDPAPGPEDVVVRVSVCAICHTDIIIRDGGAPHVVYPVVPGHEFSGVIAELGKNVKGLKAGDMGSVQTIMGCGFCPPCRRGEQMGCLRYSELGSKVNGGMAEYCVFPARYFYKAPEEMDAFSMAMAEPLANAVKALRRAMPRPRENVAVIGPGAIGVMAAQTAARYAPRRLVLIGRSAERLALASRFCDATDYVNVRDADFKERMDKALDGRGADVVIDCSGSVSGIETALDIAAPGGRIAIEGSVGVGERVPLDPRQLQGRGLYLTGISGWEAQDFQDAFDMICSGEVHAGEMITHRFPLDDWETAFGYATAKKAQSMRVGLMPWGEKI